MLSNLLANFYLPCIAVHLHEFYSINYNEMINRVKEQLDRLKAIISSSSSFSSSSSYYYYYYKLEPSSRIMCEGKPSSLNLNGPHVPPKAPTHIDKFRGDERVTTSYTCLNCTWCPDSN